jgi:hypothetical protein
MAKAKTLGSWDDVSNESKNSFVGFNEIGDYILGTLTARKQVPSTLPDRVGELQWIYEIKVRDCAYHVLDDRKKVVEEAVEPEAGDIVSVGGRAMIDSRVAKVKIGQVFGLKFTEELPAKTKGYNPTKLIKVFVPRDINGDFEMDTEWIKERKEEDDGNSVTEKFKNF